MTPYYEESGITIYHGDAREICHEEPRHSRVGVIVTDPPYGINHKSGHGASWSNTAIQGDADTQTRDDVFARLCTASFPMAIFGSWKVVPVFGHFAPVGCLVWDKGPAFGMGDLAFPWKPSFELIHIYGRGWRLVSGRMEGVLRGHIQVSWESKGRQHPNQKPVSLLRHIINHAPAGYILDPFCGTGSTLRAAKDLGRCAIGIEIEERYCEIAAKRLSQEVFDFSNSEAASDKLTAPINLFDSLRVEPSQA